MVNPLQSSEKYVYHYTKIDTALKHILKTGTLRLNSFSKVNDPRESKSWTMTTTVRSDLNLKLEDWDALSKSVSDVLKQNVKLICFCKDRVSAVNQWQIRDPIDRGFAKPSMWHHYANGHNGVCLVFDKDKLDISFKKKLDEKRLISNTVKYSDDGGINQISNAPFSINLTNSQSKQHFIKILQNHLNLWMPSLFFTKLKDWSNEEEYRWVYFDENEHPICIDFGDSLEAIVVGESVSEVYNENLLTYCVKYQADIAHLQWDNGFPKLLKLGNPYITHKHLLEDSKQT
ncbi:DUF2971 domain-containing protein [Hyella patelloides]|uniref:DUF2971 domain-containing protein n=1 Tax=Hyella patelloides TaxID=1982969 RepID=UPI001643EAC5|nr:DUF2971 domain-containing protein [Hyella patelloides]